jgi:hypothetical protein
MRQQGIIYPVYGTFVFGSLVILLLLDHGGSIANRVCIRRNKKISSSTITPKSAYSSKYAVERSVCKPARLVLMRKARAVVGKTT